MSSEPGLVRLAGSAETYFSTQSDKEGLVTLNVEHPAWAQTFWMPVTGVGKALRWLEPGFAWYAAQFEEYLVREPRMTKGFVVSGLTGSPIAQEMEWPALDDILRRTLPKVYLEALGGLPRAIHRISFKDEVDVSWYEQPKDLGIEPWAPLK